jgi:hypothetical protein
LVTDVDSGPAAAQEGAVVTGSQIVRRLGRLTLVLLAMATATTAPAAAQNIEKAWSALIKGGHVALIRHANAPPDSGGDPPGFRIDDCATQRNLDEKGRAQAKALGDVFRKHGVRVDEITLVQIGFWERENE